MTTNAQRQGPDFSMCNETKRSENALLCHALCSHHISSALPSLRDCRDSIFQHNCLCITWFRKSKQHSRSATTPVLCVTIVNICTHSLYKVITESMPWSLVCGSEKCSTGFNCAQSGHLCKLKGASYLWYVFVCSSTCSWWSFHARARSLS